MSAADDPGFARRGSVPRLVLAATAAFAALAALWSVVAPLGEAPDEPAHLALVLHLADGKTYPSYDGLENQAAIIRLCRTHASATRACPRQGEEVTRTSTRRHPIEEAPDKATRPAWNDAGGDQQVGQLNQMPQHPPLYYQAMATVLRVERALFGGPWSLDRELALLRLANVALVAPLPLLAWWAARRFRASDAAAAAAAVGVLGLPMLTHIGSTLNNDNLLTLLASGLVALLAGVVRGDRSLRTAAAVGGVVGLALLTKAFALVLPPLVVLAYLLGLREGVARSWRDRLVALAPPVGLTGAIALGVAAWWYIGVRLRTGRFAPTIEDQRLGADLAPPGFTPELWPFVKELSHGMVVRTWGSFGWYSVRFPTWLAVACTVVVAVAVIAALVPRWAAAGATRLQRAWLLLPVVLLGGFVTARAWSIYATTSKFQFIQGRYLFAGVVGATVLLGIGAAQVARRWAPLAVAVAAGLVQVAGLRRAMPGWWGGPGLGPRGQVRAMAAWSGWPGELVGLIGLVAVAAVAWLVAELVVELRRRRGDAGGEVVSTTT